VNGGGRGVGTGEMAVMTTTATTTNTAATRRCTVGGGRTARNRDLTCGTGTTRLWFRRRRRSDSALVRKR
jgi:hypothetical protein